MNYNNSRLNLNIDSLPGTATLTNALDRRQITISLRSPKLDFGDVVCPGGDYPVNLVREDTPDGSRWTGSYAPVDIAGAEAHISVWLQAYNDKLYVRKGYELVLQGRQVELPFREIEMDRVDLAGHNPDFFTRGDQSAPILADSFFFGVEFPISVARLEDSTAILASRPGIYIRTNDTFRSRDCVYAVTEPGKAAKCFRDYVQEFRAQPTDIFFGYNNWWTTPVDLTSDIIVELAEKLKRGLFDAYGVAPDVFTMDLGWSDMHSIWKIDREKFPNGFSEITEVLDKMGTRVGFWISPCSAYWPGLDNVWARDEGYETFKGDPGLECNLCMGGKRYSEDFIKNASETVAKYRVRHIKHDAYTYHCPSRDHGHLPGAYSAEPIAQRMVDFYQAARQASPDIRLNAPQRDRDTIFRGEVEAEPLPSRIPTGQKALYMRGGPWWLKYMHFMASVEGDDYPFGRCPAPVHRDTYTTARSYRVLQAALDPIIPMDCKEVFGIISQTEESPVNDAVDVLLRGHQFISLYLNPDKMSDESWGFIADIIRYGRANKEILRDTTALFPESWRQPDGSYAYGPKAMRDPYGYVHTDGSRALLYLRNPSIAEQTKTIRLDETSGFPDNDFVWNTESVFPYCRTYARSLRYGDEIAVLLQPHQNVLLELSPEAPSAPDFRKADGLKFSNLDCQLDKIRILDCEWEYGPDYTKSPRKLKPGPATATVKCSAEVNHQTNKLMVLVETESEPLSLPEVRARVNGEEAEVQLIDSRGGWSADMGPPPESWTWHVITLPKGKSDIDLSARVHSQDAELSVWLWGESAVNDPGDSPLLHPNPVDRESLAILQPTQMWERLSPEAAGVPAEEKIDGVYLDSIEPVSSVQGWRELSRNKAVTGKRLYVGDQEYQRGLGMHAVAEVVYSLNGQWSKFTAFAGPNAFEEGTLTMSVKVDDTIVWESGFMKKGDPAKKVDVDLRGAQTLTLLVGDGGDGRENDSADWGEAILWR